MSREMNKRDHYTLHLKNCGNWMEYLEENSGLPGKRGNLELMGVVAELGDEPFFLECLRFDETVAPTNTPGEFIATCGVTGLGRLVLEGKEPYYDLLKRYASDARWRVREGVAFALQIIGKKDFDGLIFRLRDWSKGNPCEKRAVVAGLCEPVLIKDQKNAGRVLDLLEEIIFSIETIPGRKEESFRVLKKGLGYGLSVAIAAWPSYGKEIFERLMSQEDRDIKWILRENLKKKRLEKMDRDWVSEMKKALVR
jgi:hypothetical protein